MVNTHVRSSSLSITSLLNLIVFLFRSTTLRLSSLLLLKRSFVNTVSDLIVEKERFFQSSNWSNQFKVMRTDQTDHSWIRLASISLHIPPRSRTLWRVLKPSHYSLPLQLADRFYCWRTMSMLTVLSSKFEQNRKPRWGQWAQSQKHLKTSYFRGLLFWVVLTYEQHCEVTHYLHHIFWQLFCNADFNGRLSDWESSNVCNQLTRIERYSALSFWKDISIILTMTSFKLKHKVGVLDSIERYRTWVFGRGRGG
jgi:hypothetical protein